jgi:serine/threonine-protein kinase SRPK3
VQEKAEAKGAHFNPHVVELLNHFTRAGPHGKHVCMVFEVLGDNLLTLINHYKYQGMPLRFVKQVARQVSVALFFLHRDSKIIHTDLKPENVLIAGLRGTDVIKELLPSLPALRARLRATFTARNSNSNTPQEVGTYAFVLHI